MADDGNGSPEEALAEFIVQRTAEMIGRIEWLHTEFQKTGAVKRAERTEGLSRRLDRICGRLDEIERVLRNSGGGEPATVEKDVMDRLDALLRGKTSALEQTILEATEEGVVFTDELATGLSERLEELASALEECEPAFGLNPARRESPRD